MKKKRQKNVLKEIIENARNIKPKTILFLILLFALSLRLYFFMGYINAHDLDEGIYIEIIKSIYKGTYNLDKYKNLPKSFIANPAETFQFRPVLLYPIAFLWFLFGVSDFTSTLYPLMCSLGSIVVIYYIGKLLFNDKVGLLAAFLLSIYPLDIFFATRIMCDLVVGFFISSSIFFFLKAERKKIIKKQNLLLRYDYYIFSGILLGLAYLVKTTALILIPFFIIYIIFKRKFELKYAYLFFGFFIIFSIAVLYYFIQTGHPLLNLEIPRSAYIDSKYGESTVITKNFIGDKIKYSYDDGEPFFYLKSIFYNFRRFPEVYFFGYFYYFIFIAIISLLLLKKKDTYFLLFWFLFLFLYLELGPVGIKFDSKNFSINYLMLFKRERFLNILSVPMMLILSYSFLKLRKEFLLLILCFLFLTSIYFVYKGREYFLTGMYSIREVAKYLNGFPNTDVYTDNTAALMIQYYSSYKRDDKIKFYDYNNPDQIKDAFVIVGGSRGVELSNTVVEESYKKIMSNYNESWKLVKVIPTPFKKYDTSARDLEIFYIS